MSHRKSSCRNRSQALSVPLSPLRPPHKHSQTPKSSRCTFYFCITKHEGIFDFRFSFFVTSLGYEFISCENSMFVRSPRAFNGPTAVSVFIFCPIIILRIFRILLRITVICQLFNYDEIYTMKYNCSDNFIWLIV
jgi:hypothetical protein